jgi:plastocyanin
LCLAYVTTDIYGKAAGAFRQGEEQPNKEDPLMRRLLQLATLSFVVLLVFAPAAWAQGQEVTVRMEDNSFSPAHITVEPGTTVTWVQSGNNPHTTTSYDGLWDSGMIEGGSGGTFSFTFEEPGTYDYFCIPHEEMGMVGSVTVSGGTTASPTGTATATASPTSTALADTGGPSVTSLVATTATLALVVCGLITLILLRRSSAS